jgi:asparagine synthase (glutamine-hydrolysing)
VGLENSPDIKAAQKVADFLGTVHHSYTYTIQEGLDAIREVIYHLETFDTTTVRASTPMFLMVSTPPTTSLLFHIQSSSSSFL